VSELLAASAPWIVVGYVAAWTLTAIALGQMHTLAGMRFDTYEMLLMGHEWQPAYWKHPALPPWIAEAVSDLTGRSVFALAILPVLWIAWALWLVNRLSRPIFGAAGATVATALSLGSWYLMAAVGHFNHNIAQLPFWALAVLLYRRAVLTPSYGAWVGLALTAELLLQTKYTGALLLVTLAAHALCFKQGRRALRTPQAWLGIVLALALVVPQGLHLLLLDHTALTYAVQDRESFRSWHDYLIAPVAILAPQLAFHVAVFALVLAAYPFGLRQRAQAVVLPLPGRTDFDTSLIIAASAVPLLLGIVFYTVAGAWARSEAFGSMFILVGPSVLACTDRFIRVARPRLTLALFALVLLAPPIGNMLDPMLGPALFHRIGTEQIPYDEGTGLLARVWSEHTSQPLTIIAGEHRVAGGFAAFMSPRPSVLIDGMLGRSPWIRERALRERGALVVWRISDPRRSAAPASLMAALSGYPVRVLRPIRLATVWDHAIPPVQFGVAIITPGVASSANQKTRTNPGL